MFEDGSVITRYWPFRLIEVTFKLTVSMHRHAG